MIVFTLCSNNYLAHAKTLGDSILVHDPGALFVIGLVDERHSEIDYTDYDRFTILEAREIGIENFEDLFKKYSIVEFNTCVKASYFKYFFKNYTDINAVLFFDPDIMLFNSLDFFKQKFTDYDILVIPHILTPLSIADTPPNENLFLNYGLYNLGFIGVHRNCTQGGGFLDWWENRLLLKGYKDPCNGYFVDQLWINLVPIFYENVKILREPGLDVAPWNLHERKIVTGENNSFQMSDGNDLIFYHFSSYNFNNPGKLSNYDRFSFTTNPELKPLYELYHSKLIENHIPALSKILCIYMNKKLEYEEQINKAALKNGFEIKKIIKQFVPPIIWKAFRYISK